MQFTIQYDDRVVRGAINTFVKRRVVDGMGWPGLLAFVVTTAALAYLLWQGDRTWVVGVIGAVLGFTVLLVVVLWQWRHLEMRRRLAAIPNRQGVVTASEDSITIATDAGAATLPWSSFSEFWKLERCWLLFLAPNNFVTLPTDGVPQDALNYIEERLST